VPHADKCGHHGRLKAGGFSEVNMGKGARHRNERKVAASSVTVTKRKNVWKKLLTAAITVLICAAILGTLVYSVVRDNGTIMKYTTVMTIDGEKITADELEFYYNSIIRTYENYNSYYETYYGIEDFYGVDFDSNLFKQEYSEDQSWGEFLREEAIDQLYNTIILYQEAVKAGYTLTDEMIETVDEAMASLDDSAETYDVSAKYLLKISYGNAITLEKYRFYLERDEIVAQYSEDIYEGFVIGDEEKAAKYLEDPTVYDLVNYYTLSYTPEIEEDSETTFEDIKAQVLADIAALTSLDEFIAYGKELTATTDDDGNVVEGTEASLSENVTKSSLSDERAEWMYADGRVEGDVNVFDSDTTMTLVYFVSRDDLGYATRSIRHIVLESDEEDEEVLAEIQGIYDDWLNGLQTEESFGVYADSYSDDTSAEGGLYTEVYKGMRYDELDAWLFDDERQVGDTAIIFTEDAGYHLVYYVGEGDTYRDVLVDTDLRDEDYDTYIKALQEAKPMVRNESGIKKVK